MSLTKPSCCASCVLYQNGCGFIQPEGSGSLGVMIIGEAAGAQEASDGLPFRPHAASGSLLERCFRRCGWSREQFYISNVLKCQPPGNALDGEKYEYLAIANCQHFLDDEIAAMKPRCILALGGVAARTLTGMAGHKQGISSIRGFVLNSPRYGIPVVCSLHPAYLRRGYMKYMGILIRDMQLAVQVAQQGIPADLYPARYLEQPTKEKFNEFVLRVIDGDPTRPVAYDIETSFSHSEDEDEVSVDSNAITLVQFSLGPGEGIAVPWTREYIDGCKVILGSPNPKLGFNVYHFDNPKLRAAGCEVKGDITDLMWAWHALQPDLPRGLQPVASFYAPEFGPWKHTSGMDLANYGCKDVDILQRIWPKLQADMKQHGVWDCYERHVRQLWPILERMSQRGLPIDAERQAAFRTDLEQRLAKVDAELQEIYPAHLKEVQPKKGFVRQPKETDGMVQIEVLAKVPCKVPCQCVDEDGVITGWNKKVVLRCVTCKGKGLVKGPPVEQLVKRWARPLPFKPSPPQLIRYMHYRKHKVPKVIGGDRETTSKLFIERMSRDYKDPLYKGLLEYRSIQKFKGSYLWAPAADGRVHAEFKFSPATGQLAASNPNVLTIPTEYKAGPMAKVFRQVIHAKPGHVLVECIDPNARILMHDMTWKAARDILVDDVIVGFDENPTPQESGNRPSRKVRKAVVKSWRIITKPRVRITTNKGSIICSSDHCWLTNNTHNAHWEHAENLKVGDTISYFTKPWNVDTSYEAAYLAGFMDGEGYTSGSVVGFGQNTGPTLNHVLNLFRTKTEFNPRHDTDRLYEKTGRTCSKFALQDGEAFTALRFVGTLRPVRLLKKVQDTYEGRTIWGKNTKPAIILSVEPIEDGEVVAIETSTHTFIAEGYLSHNCDVSGFHTSTFALEAQDPAYFRLANIIKDPHSFLAAVMLKQNTPERMLAMQDDELLAYLSSVKKSYKAIRDGQAKPAILGYALGLGGNKLFEMNRFDPLTGAGFASKREAEQLISTLRECFPRGYAYQQEIRAKAQRQGYLLNRHGYIRRFWDVLRNNPITGVGELGEQANEAAAFDVQADAHGHLKEMLLEMQALGWLERYNLINVVHDSVVFEVQQDLLEECIHNVCNLMEQPSKVLSDPVLCPAGLVIGVEAKYGPDLSDMRGFKR